MKSELRKILEAFISDSTFYGEVGPEVVEAENQAVDAILELFNKQLPDEIDYKDVYEYKIKSGITVSEAIKEADIYNSCLADIKSRLEE